ncbi:hypothetical protein N7488_003962 [Penicillium malachiteum]|nr:hypothetical protein N7488_003962 [Penicillium malachiteum]
MILAEDSDPLELAQVAISRVANIASELGVELRRPVCGRLGAELLLLADYIDKASQDQEDQLRSRIFKLLRDVESICRSSEETKSLEKSRKNRFPILEAIGESVPGLEIYKKARAEIREGLAKLTGHPKFAEKTIEHFRGFTKPSRRSSKLDAGFNTTSTRKTSEPQYPRHVNELVYRTLREYAYCSCEVDGIREVMRKSHLARLLLQPPCEEEFTRRNMYQFDLLFSSGPLEKEAMLRHWQDVELMVPDVNSKVKKHAKRVQRARFIDDLQTADYRITMNNSPTQRLSQGQFCRLIGLEANSRLCLSINDGELQHYFAPLKKLVEHTPGISLADTLKHYPPLTARMKLVLAYIIAYSVWQYYDSDWMKTKWSSETIQFIKEFEDNRCGSCDPAKLFTWKPYLSVNFNDDESECQEFNRLDGGVHNYPRIRALGILLVEIGIGAPLHSQSLKKGLVAQVNSDLLSARGYIKDPKMWRNLEFEQYREAAAQCLDPAIFSLAPFDAGASPQESRDSLRQRRNILYDKVVFPLEDLLHGTKWMEDWTRIGPLDSPTKFPAFQQFFPGNDDIEDSNGKKKIEKKRKRTTTEKEALNWLLRMDHFNQEMDHFIAAGKLSQPSQPVRIAILDTGYDSSAPCFYKPNVMSRMKGWKDFVDGIGEAEDCHGHGTHLVSLILKCAPHAELYVARVAKTPNQLLDSSQNVADAITWASRKCQADVISMSLGFQDEQPCISNAIREVLFERKDSIIMLAAASNYGFNDGEMFPARHDSVISIRATNANGDFLSSNPPRNEHEDIEFGTLGLDVPSYWVNSDIEVHKSGSSISTAITAGLTGSLLGYIRSKPDDETSQMVKERALTRRGMQAIFRILSQRIFKPGCLYLTPWKLMGKPEDVRWSKLVDALDEV